MSKLTARTMAELQKEVKAELERRCGYGSLKAYARDPSSIPTAGESVKASQAAELINQIIQVNDTDVIKVAPNSGELITYNLEKEASDFLDKIQKETMVGPESSCRGQCSGLCTTSCTTSCVGCTGCTGTCGTTCASGCISCTGTCTDTCGSNCGTGCTAGCGTGCTVGCTSTCKGCSSCGGCSGCSGCGSGCNAGCTGCTGGCSSACSGCTGCGGCAGNS